MAVFSNELIYVFKSNITLKCLKEALPKEIITHRIRNPASYILVLS